MGDRSESKASGYIFVLTPTDIAALAYQLADLKVVVRFAARPFDLVFFSFGADLARFARAVVSIK